MNCQLLPIFIGYICVVLCRVLCAYLCCTLQNFCLNGTLTFVLFLNEPFRHLRAFQSAFSLHYNPFNNSTIFFCRFFLIIWFLYSFNLNLIYQSQLIVMLTQPSTEHQITTQDEIISSKISFGFPKNFEVNFFRLCLVFRIANGLTLKKLHYVHLIERNVGVFGGK